MNKLSKINDCWNKIFEEYQILHKIKTDGLYEISAKTINNFREARLMTKFDHSSELPKIFIENKLSIQPNSRGSYLIGEFNSYFNLPRIRPPKIKNAHFPEHITTIDKDDIYSEASAILCAYNSNILSDFLGSECHITVMGRMSTGEFEYEIDKSIKGDEEKFKIHVKNAQCEIDGGFETEDSFAIIEAKNRATDDFLIRQLYYPFRLWQNKSKKQVTPILLCTCDGVYSLYKFRFKEALNYSSLEVIDYKRYRIGLTNIGLSDLLSIASSVVKISEPKVPFPQANSLGRIVELIERFSEQGEKMTTLEIALDQNFDIRQADYYGNAATYLGLLKREGSSCFAFTEIAKKLHNKTQKEIYLAFVGLILSHSVFLDVFQFYIEKAKRPNIKDVVNIMEKYELYDLPKGSSTRTRRASTVLRWIDWIIDLQDTDED